MNKFRFAVVVLKSWTRSQVVAPKWFRTRLEAEQEALDFNRSSQDSTWNAPEANVIDTWSDGRI